MPDCEPMVGNPSLIGFWIMEELPVIPSGRDDRFRKRSLLRVSQLTPAKLDRESLDASNFGA